MKVAELHYIGAVYRRGRREALEQVAKILEEMPQQAYASEAAAAIRALTVAEK
jgi:hypothetical protein